MTRLSETRESFNDRDPLKSKLIHDKYPVIANPSHEEPTLDSAKFLKPAVFGGLDGISTIFALIAGSAGAQLSLAHLLAVGTGTLIAGAFGMGMGEYVSAKADKDVALREFEREEWEVENYPEGEIQEMMAIYQNNGVSATDSEIIARTLAKYKTFWVEHMLLTEIGILPVDPKESLILPALTMFVSFAVFGAIPLLAYALISILRPNLQAFLVTTGCSMITLLILGAVKAHILGQARIKSGLLMVLQGGICAASAYWLGDVVQQTIESFILS
jgi:VIT1/CCC1 family predicted Fe2+/Mn2+ transporter